MNSVTLRRARITGVWALALMMISASLFTGVAWGQQADKAKDQGPKISDGERKALEKIETTADLPTKIKLAGEFVKKYPASPMRGQVSSYIGGEIAKVEDPAQKVTFLESALQIFDQPKEAELLFPALINTYIKGQKYDEALAATAKYIEKNPNDVYVLTNIALTSTEQVKAQNAKFVAAVQLYAPKAIALIEADKKPEAMEDEKWNEYKTQWLPGLYQALGIVAYLTKNKADAKVKLEKAVSLNATDPVTYMLLGGLVDDEYRELAQKHQTMGPGPLKEQTLKEAQAKMDEVIEIFAQTVALAAGKEAFQRMHDSLLEQLTTYYKYRKGSTAGLQELIDKYKK